MLQSYEDFTKRFGASLRDVDFQAFLKENFFDLTEYNVIDGYMVSAEMGVELGFINPRAVYDDEEEIVFDAGNPIFSHINAYPKSASYIGDLPFGTTFADTRVAVIAKAGEPVKTNEGFSDFLHRHFLVDSYKIGKAAIAFDYNVENQSINFIGIRENDLLEHLRL